MLIDNGASLPVTKMQGNTRDLGHLRWPKGTVLPEVVERISAIDAKAVEQLLVDWDIERPAIDLALERLRLLKAAPYRCFFQ